MARTESTMLSIGTQVPKFRLPDVTSGKLIGPEDFPGRKALLVMFICRHCPYVQRVQHELARIGKDYADKPVGIIAISSNDPEAYPEDAPDSLRDMAAQAGFVFPFCYDEDQSVARAFSAVCTPEFYVFDVDGRLAYRGQLDDSRREGKIPVTGSDVRNAIDALLQGKAVSTKQIPSIGCSIKWRAAAAAS